MPPPLRLPNTSEQHVLNHLRLLRLITEAERPRWNAEVAAHHYLQNATLVGDHLCYVVEYQSTWLALLGLERPGPATGARGTPGSAGRALFAANVRHEPAGAFRMESADGRPCAAASEASCPRAAPRHTSSLPPGHRSVYSPSDLRAHSGPTPPRRAS